MNDDNAEKPNSLREKMELSDVFTVVVNKKYLQKLIELDPKILRQISLATELKKPFIVIIDSNLTDDDKTLTRSIFSNFNVVREIEVDLKNTKSVDDVFEEIDRLAREYAIKAGKNIEEGLEIFRE